jgi:hypothetical protein
MIIVLVFVLAITNGILIYQWSQAMSIAVAAAHGTTSTAHAISILPNVTK